MQTAKIFGERLKSTAIHFAMARHVLSRKKKTQCVIYSSGPGQHVLYAFFTFLFLNVLLREFYLPTVRFFYSDQPPRFLPRFNAFFFNTFFLTRFFPS